MTGSQGMPPPPPWLAIGTVVVLTAVATSLAAYIWVRTTLSPQPDVAIPATPTPANTPLSALAVEQRENGVQALRAGEYVLAIASFETALKLDPTIADVGVLLDVARRLQDAEAINTTHV
ncbi:MAG: tetratricopeptide repeat protein, partial [Myxococcota bacterium]